MSEELNDAPYRHRLILEPDCDLDLPRLERILMRALVLVTDDDGEAVTTSYDGDAGLTLSIGGYHFTFAVQERPGGRGTAYIQMWGAPDPDSEHAGEAEDLVTELAEIPGVWVVPEDAPSELPGPEPAPSELLGRRGPPPGRAGPGQTATARRLRFLVVVNCFLVSGILAGLPFYDPIVGSWLGDALLLGLVTSVVVLVTIGVLDWWRSRPR